MLPDVQIGGGQFEADGHGVGILVSLDEADLSSFSYRRKRA